MKFCDHPVSGKTREGNAKGRHAYRVSLADFVVFARSGDGAETLARDVIGDGALRLEPISPDQLKREFGDTYPPIPWDPDQEMTCAEIADEIADEAEAHR